MNRIGPHSRPTVLAKLDGRRREAKLLQAFRSDLTEHVGGKPSVTQKALIERAAWLSLHIALMDAAAIDRGGMLSERDSRQYLAWSNTLARALRELGIKPAKGNTEPSNVRDYLDKRS